VVLDIYEAGYFVAGCKKFALKGENGEWLLLLQGINLFTGDAGIQVVPVYVPFLEIHHGGGQLVIDFYLWRKRVTTIIFQKAYPYFLWKTFDLKFKEPEDES